ncbi:MAG: ACP S-malonyltransferase [Armatimonadetes bacterium]|nr:ACP S-malonyltransferase [Armatimonadota bacterium]MBS1700027.1 ACP S-malonyltransferase [Armatimonadota bacterium]MBS1726832.1 ACP S-malonyltransferase [Armatimonadota bacterium]
MIAAIFPGQGSQKPGMGQSLYEGSEAARHVFEHVSDCLHTDVAKLCFESDEETLRATQNAQIALFTCGVAAYRALETEGYRAEVFAGHSIGEYAAHVCAGNIPLEVGAPLVRKRGNVMAEAGKTRPGTMAAVLGLDADVIQEALKQVSGVVVIANDNCPGQVVISGEVEAVAAAGPVLTEAGAKRVLPLNVSGAFHSPLMNMPSKEMARSLATVDFAFGKPVYSNVTAEPVENPCTWNDLLEQQLRDSVRWTASVRNMINDGVTQFIECGVGEVLCGLIKRIDKEVPSRAVYDMETLRAAN